MCKQLKSAKRRQLLTKSEGDKQIIVYTINCICLWIFEALMIWCFTLWCGGQMLHLMIGCFFCSKTSLLTNSKNLKLEVYVTREFASWPISRVWVFSSQARLGHSSISSLGILPVKSSDTLNNVQYVVHSDVSVDLFLLECLVPHRLSVALDILYQNGLLPHWRREREKERSSTHRGLGLASLRKSTELETL